MKTGNVAMLVAMYAAALNPGSPSYLKTLRNSDGNFAGAIAQHKKNIAKRIKNKKRGKNK